MRSARILPAAALAVAGLVLLGCERDGGSPTGPRSLQISFEGDFRNTDGHSTIQVFRLVLDERTVSTSTIPNGSGPRVTVRGNTEAESGRHTASLVISDQTSTPNTYTGWATIVVLDRDQRLRFVHLEEQTRSLATGEGLAYTFDL